MTDRIDVAEDPIDKIIRVSLREFSLRLLKMPKDANPYKFEVIAEYEIAHGTEEFPTPRGDFLIMRKAKNPDWHPPDSKWVGPELRDKTGKTKVVPGGHPDNPIRGAFLDIGDGYGIHGTLNEASIGTRASHGCMRVTEKEAFELYRRVPAGTPVLIR